MRRIALLLTLLTVGCHSYREGSQAWYDKWYLRNAKPGDFTIRSIKVDYRDCTPVDSADYFRELTYPVYLKDTSSLINVTIRQVLAEYISQAKGVTNLDSTFRDFAFRDIASDARDKVGESGFGALSSGILSACIVYQDETLITVSVCAGFQSGIATDSPTYCWSFVVNASSGNLLKFEDVFSLGYRNDLDSIAVTRERFQHDRRWDIPPDTLGSKSDTFFVYPGNKYELSNAFGVFDSSLSIDYTFKYGDDYEGFMWPEEMKIYIPIRELASIIPETSPLYHLIRKQK